MMDLGNVDLAGVVVRFYDQSQPELYKLRLTELGCPVEMLKHRNKQMNRHAYTWCFIKGTPFVFFYNSLK